MNQDVLNFLKAYSYNTWDVNRLLVSSFLILNDISKVKNSFINKYIILSNTPKELEQLNTFVALLKEQTSVFNFSLRLKTVIFVFFND